MGTYKAMIGFLLVALLATVGAASASASDPDVHERAMYLTRSQRYADAADLAAEALKADPSSLAAHVAYQTAWSWMGELRFLVQQYRAWYEDDPDNDVARIALARVLLLDDRVGNRDEVEGLLDPLPDDVDVRFWAVRTLYDSRTTANPPGVVGPLLDELQQLGEGDEYRAAVATITRAHNAPVEGPLARELDRVTRTFPWLIDDVAFALWDDHAEGSKLEQARAKAIKRAKATMTSDDPLFVMSTSLLFGEAGELELERAADRRLIELDAGWAEVWNPIYTRLKREMDRKDPERSLEILDEIEAEATTDKERATVWNERSRMLAIMDKRKLSQKAVQTAHELDPDNVIIIERLARGSHLGHTGQEEALQILDHAISLVLAEDYGMDTPGYRDGYDEWRKRHNQRLAKLYELQAMLLLDLGRLEDSAGSYRMALALDERDVYHSHLGFLYRELDQHDLAFEHLARGVGETLAWRPTKGWDSRPYWHPEGVSGYFEDRAAAPDPSEESHDGEVGPGEANEDHALLGQPFPDLVFDLEGDTARLSDYEGPLLVEFWNTW